MLVLNKQKRKLTEEQVKYIRSNYIPRHTMYGASAMARRFNVGKNLILSVINNIRYTDII